MAFDRNDLAAYEQQPQEMVEIATPQVEVAADVPPVAETTADPAAPPAEESSGADDTASGESSGDESVDEGAPTSPGEPSAATEVPAKGSARARIMELVDERNSYKDFGKLQAEEAARLRAELAALKGQKPAAATDTPDAPAAVANTDEDTPPSPEDADVQYDPVKLAQKNAQWIQKQIKKGVSEELAQRQTQESQIQVVRNFESRVKGFEATEAGKDFKKLVGNPELPQLHTFARAQIVKSDLGPQILHELAKDVSEAKRIAALSPEDQLVEIGDIKARIKLASKAPASAAPAAAPTPVTKKQPKTVSSAPPPPTRTPAGSVSTERPLSDPSLSMEEFVKRDRERIAADRAAKRAGRLGMR